MDHIFYIFLLFSSSVLFFPFLISFLSLFFPFPFPSKNTKEIAKIETKGKKKKVKLTYFSSSFSFVSFSFFSLFFLFLLFLFFFFSFPLGLFPVAPLLLCSFLRCTEQFGHLLVFSFPSICLRSNRSLPDLFLCAFFFTIEN